MVKEREKKQKRKKLFIYKNFFYFQVKTQKNQD